MAPVITILALYCTASILILKDLFTALSYMISAQSRIEGFNKGFIYC